MPHEDEGTDGAPPPPKPTTQVKVKDNADRYEITWPNVLRVDYVMGKRLTADVEKIESLTIDAASVILSTELRSVVDGKARQNELAAIDLEKIMKCFRLQTVLLKAAGEMYGKLKDEYKDAASKTVLVGDLYSIADAFVAQGKVIIDPPLFTDERQKSAVLCVCCTRIVEHVLEHVMLQSADRTSLTIDRARPVCSTRDMITKYTTRPVAIAQKAKSQVACATALGKIPRTMC